MRVYGGRERASRDARRAAEQREQHGLGQELHPDVPLRGAQSPANIEIKRPRSEFPRESGKDNDQLLAPIEEPLTVPR